MSDLPVDLRFTESHEWVAQAEDGTLRVGITDHAQSKLGDLVFVDLPDVDAEFAAGDACAVVESVKAASDIYAPVGGVITAVNESLEDAPESVNQDAYGEGWLFELRPSSPGDWEKLMNAETYKDSISD